MVGSSSLRRGKAQLVNTSPEAMRIDFTMWPGLYHCLPTVCRHSVGTKLDPNECPSHSHHP